MAERRELAGTVGSSRRNSIKQDLVVRRACVVEQLENRTLLDGQNPVISEIGQWGGAAMAVAVAGTKAYVGRGPNLVVIDVSNPAFPQERGRVLLPGTVQDIAVVGDYAYVADDDSGLQIINISNPAAPTLTGGCNLYTEMYGVSVAGNYAYLASHSGLYVVDVANRAAPQWRAIYPSNYAEDVNVIGSYAYVADQVDGLKIFNVTNPLSAVLVGTCDTPGNPMDLSVVGNYAYVMDYGSGLQIVNISNRANPIISGSFPVNVIPGGVMTAGNYAYVAVGKEGLRVIDVTNPAAPVLAGTYDTLGSAYAVSVAGNYAYVADSDSGLQVINISNPAAPTWAGTHGNSGTAYGVSTVGNFAYIAGGDGGLHILDVSNPAAATLLGTYNTSGSAYDVSVVGNYAYVADDERGLRIINITNPFLPTLAGTYDTSGSAHGISVVGSYAYVADYDRGLQVIDISNPVAPRLVGTCDTSGIALSVRVVGNYAYVADYSSGLQIISIANPTAPVLAGTFDTSGNAWGVDVAGDYAYVADSWGGLRVINVANPAAPVLVGTYTTGPQAQNVRVAGNYAYVAYGFAGLGIINISDPALPTLAAMQDTSGNPWSVSVSGDLVYVADTFDGVGIFRVHYPPSDVGISDATVAENQPAGTAVGMLSASDLNAGDSFTFSLVSGTGGTDNGSFTISGNQLLTAAGFDYEVKNSYSIRVRSTDQGGLWYEKVFTITVTDVDETSPTVTAVYVKGSTWTSTFLSFLAANLSGSTSTYGFAIPVGSGDTQLQTLPWRNLDRISVRFSEDVSVAQAQFAIVGSVGSYSVSGFSYNSTDHVATWSLSAVIGADKLYVALPGSGATPVTDVAGNLLDGEWTNPTSFSDVSATSTFPSGNGVAGGDFAFRFDVLPGDSTGGSLGKVNVADIAQTKSRSSLPETASCYRSDFDGNNLINVADIAYVKSKSSIYSLPTLPPLPPTFGPVFSQVSLLLRGRPWNLWAE